MPGEPQRIGRSGLRQLNPHGNALHAKWASEVAAADRHRMLFHSPPGVGKTMLAERVPGLLHDLDEAVALANPRSTCPASP
jgi:magnesium chelatase family protein